MRILHAVNSPAPVGGIETYVLDLIPLLAEEGHESALVYCRQDASAPTALDYQTFRVSGVGASAHEALTRFISSFAPDVAYIHDIYDPELVKLISAQVASVGFMHIFYPVCPGLGKLFRATDEVCKRPFGVGCIPNIYLKQCASARDPRNVLRIMSRTQQHLSAYHTLRKIVVASDYMADLLKQNGLVAPVLEVIPLPYFVPPTPPPDDSYKRDNAILFAGRLEYEKGLPYLLQAVARMEQPCTLWVIGDGSLKESYQQQADDLGISNVTQFFGWTSQQELYERYRLAALTVMPSIMPEPFGKVGVEAMMNGSPVVAFNVGGISEWLIDNETGYLVESGDTVELARVMGSLLGDAARARALGRAARAHALEHYSPQLHIQRLIPLLEEAAA